MVKPVAPQAACTRLPTGAGGQLPFPSTSNNDSSDANDSKSTNPLWQFLDEILIKATTTLVSWQIIKTQPAGYKGYQCSCRPFLDQTMTELIPNLDPVMQDYGRDAIAWGYHVRTIQFLQCVSAGRLFCRVTRGKGDGE
jgi:hypothetical protein